MLSRVADSLYWINRYLERAENISRFLEVSEAMALDCPPGSAEPWLPLVEVTGDRHRFDTAYPGATPKQVGRFLLLDRSNPNSIVSCIAMARENARQIRDVITTEMWEQINDLHWSLQDDEDIWREPVQEQLRIIRRGCQLVYGITDTTLSRDLSWLFSQLGRLIERADKTSRILDVKYFLLLPSPEVQHAISPASVARFLLLDPIFPRSVRYCLQGISDTLQQIQQLPTQDTPDDLDCLRGQLLARWSYVRIDNLIEAGLHEAIDQLQQDLNQLHNLIQTRYFTSADLHSIPTDPACALSSFTA